LEKAKINKNHSKMKSFVPHHNIKILQDKVLFSILRKPPRNTTKTVYFTVEDQSHFQYRGFFNDFGPPSILQLYSFTKMIEEFLSKSNQTLHFYVSPNQEAKSNAALYITAFRMLHRRMSPEEAFKPLKPIASALKPFRDASTLPSTFDLTVLDCLRGLKRAMDLGWFDMETFDPETWARLEAIENGDMNWIIPNKLLAFASPYPTNVIGEGIYVATPADVIPTFRGLGITHIVRLNKQFYDADVFKNEGFKHTELYFTDGSTPPISILQRFLEIIESDDVVALHCKAGLGRTGTLAGCYMIKNYGFTAREVIGWIRLCRGGSIIGPQQHYLVFYYNGIRRPQTEEYEKHLPRRPLVSCNRLVHNPSKGIPTALNDDPQGVNHAPKWRKQESARVPIRRPFKPCDKLCVRATAINSFHPQPRKVNQKEVI
jgi:cell division cycle 14